MTLDKEALGLPWNAVTDTVGEWMVNHQVTDAPGVCWVGNCVGMSEQQARLIAAAPELAEALEAVIEFEQGWTYKACAALKKAGLR